MCKIEKTLEKLDYRIFNIQKKINTFLGESKESAETRAKKLAASKTAIAVQVTDIVTGEIRTYPSARRAAEALNASNSTIINKVNNKNTKPYKGRFVIKAYSTSSAVVV